MIDKRLRYQYGGGADMGASSGAPGPGDTGGEGGFGRDTDQFGQIGSSPTSTGGGDGPAQRERERVKQQILDQTVIGTNELNPSFFSRVAGIPSAFRTLSLKNLYDQKLGLKSISPSIFGTIANIINPQLNVYSKTDPDLDMYGMTGEDLTDIDRLADAINTSELYGGITQSDFEKAFYGPEGKPDFTGGGDGGGITTLPYVPTTIEQQVQQAIPVEQSPFYQMLRRNLGLI
jgi:hypothetical protein